MRKVFGRLHTGSASPRANASQQVAVARLALGKTAIMACALVAMQASCRGLHVDQRGLFDGEPPPRQVSARRTAAPPSGAALASGQSPPRVAAWPGISEQRSSSRAGEGGASSSANPGHATQRVPTGALRPVAAISESVQGPLDSRAAALLIAAQPPRAGRAPPIDEAGGPADEIIARDVEATEFSQRLQLPPNLPGARAPHIRLPLYNEEDLGPRNRVIDEIFPDLPPVWPLEIPQPTPERPAMTLKRLQGLADDYNPMLIQARANVTSMEGDAIQAGLHPNPTVGYESDTVGSAQNRDYQGVFVSQLVKTANKLNLARSAANVDVLNAQLALRRTRMEVFARVKTNYFAVLVAQENVIVNTAMVRLAEEVYRIQRTRLRTAGEAAGFEVGQLRGLADVAKTQLVFAKNTYVAAWKALAAHLGLPNMPPMPLAGRADMPVPVVTYDAALRRMLSVHPDIIIGRNMVTRANYALRLEEARPIPDVVLYFTAQKDFTQPGARSTSYNSQVGLPLPIWDRNRGNIISARGDLMQASQQIRRAEMELTAQLANTFNQYSTNRITAQYYADKILPDYARAYRGVYEQYQLAPDPMGFEGIIVAQTNLTNAIVAYIAALNQQWAAVADLSYLMQVETLEEMAALGGGRVTPAPEPIPPPASQPIDARRNAPGGRP